MVRIKPNKRFPKDVENLQDNLEPHYDNIDNIVERVIQPKVSNNQFKYFEACQFKIKGIWSLYNRIQILDNHYKKYLSLCISKNVIRKLKLRGNSDCYFYFPFYEALEFENLLGQGKACLDCFSKAIGSMYGESPNNIDKLLSVLEGKKDDKVNKIIEPLRKAKEKLRGSIIDPKKGRKGIRDLISHRERIDIFFTIRPDAKEKRYILSEGALLNFKHPEIDKFPNYLVKEISAKIWSLLFGIIENCFSAQFK
jgi:hypothetical protein